MTKKLSEEHKKNISQALKGRKLPESVKEKIRQKLKGRKLSKEQILHLSNIRKGHTVSKETRRKIGLAHKGKKISLKHRKIVSEANKGKNSHRWKNGRVKDKGYVKILVDNYPNNKNGYVMEHRLVMENYLGRFLKPEEIVHHLDFNKENNNIENLHLFKNNKEHTQYHVFLKSLVTKELKGD